jgi:hypothetical protein
MKGDITYCEYCGAPFVSRGSNHKICDNPECHKKRNKIRNDKYLKRRKTNAIQHELVPCKYCGRLFKPKRENHTVCGRPSCVSKHAKERYKRYRDKVFKDFLTGNKTRLCIICGSVYQHVPKTALKKVCNNPECLKTNKYRVMRRRKIAREKELQEKNKKALELQYDEIIDKQTGYNSNDANYCPFR